MAARLFTLAVLLSCLPVSGAQPMRVVEAAESMAICLLSPAAQPEVQGVVRAVSPVADPTIFARGDFLEIRLERDGRVLWRRQSDGITPLQGPQAWPLPPLRAGEQLRLRLRPTGVAENNYADVEVIAADAATLERTAQLRQSLGRDPMAWQQAVIRELTASRTAVALALLFDFHGPSSPELDALRREIHDRACDSAILGPQEVAR